MRTAEPPRRYRPDVDGLRAVAVLAVVLFHASPGRLPGGFAGVDVFFVISGFLISGIIWDELEAGAFTIRQFYVRRVRRIFPVLLVVLAATVGLGWVLLLPTEFRALSRHAAASALFVANVASWLDAGYFSPDSESVPLLHLWSLGVEEQFYLVWPLALMFAHRRRLSVAAVLALIGVVSFAINLYQVGTHPRAAFFLPFSRLWELAVGAGAAWHGRRQGRTQDERWRTPASLVGLLLLGVALVVLDGNRAFPGLWALLPVMGTALIVAAGPNAAPNRVFLAARPVRYVGLISYALYLWHWPLLALAHAHLGHAPDKAHKAVLIGMAFVLAALSRRFLENPVRSSPARWGRPVPLLAGMVLAGSAGLLAEWAAGPPGLGAASAQERGQLLDGYDTQSAYRGGRCFLDTTTAPHVPFADECLTGPASAPLVVLWGDSHAAHLFPGLDAMTSSAGFQLLQQTATQCPPLLGGLIVPNDLACASIREEIQQRIRALRPDTVVLASRWSRDTTGLEEKLARTVAFLKEAGVRQVVLVGPPPRWIPTLQGVLVRAYLKDQRIPERLAPQKETSPEILVMDQRLRAIGAALGVGYLSAWDMFCDHQGCLARLGNDRADLTCADYDHLTAMGSRYLWERARENMPGLFKFQP